MESFYHLISTPMIVMLLENRDNSVDPRGKNVNLSHTSSSLNVKLSQSSHINYNRKVKINTMKDPSLGCVFVGVH